jgi:hypothetical protein
MVTKKEEETNWNWWKDVEYLAYINEQMTTNYTINFIQYVNSYAYFIHNVYIHCWIKVWTRAINNRNIITI